MIGTIQLRVSAHSPQMPLQPIFTFKGSPSSLRIMDVPKAIGQWNITRVYVNVTSPDNKGKVYDCVRQGSVWVGTIDGTEIVGKVKSGIEILADGIDENGSNVNGYVLGVGDYIVLERDSRITEKDIEKFYVRFSDELPINPVKGDMMVFGGSVRIFDGSEWIDCGVKIEKLSELENDVGYITQADVPTNISQLENDVGYLTETGVKNLYSSDEQTRVKGDGSIETFENVLVYRFNYALTYDNNDPMKDERNFTVVRDGTDRLKYLHIYDEDGNEITKVVAKDGNYTYSFTYTIGEVTYNGECAQTKTSQYENKWVATDNLFKASQIPTTKLSQFNNDLTIPRPSVDYVTPEQLKVTTDKIPEQASPTNQLADKDFVNSSIMTNTSYFKGTFNSVDELPTDRVTPNDYAFVVGKDSAGNTTYNRYKFTADGQWMFEYTLNNSSFTAEQWATINSGLTATSLDDYAKKSEIDNTKIYSTKIAETSPQHGDRKILGNGEMWEYGSVYNFQVTLDDRDPQKDTREVTIVEKMYLNESKTIGWLYIITMDGDKDLAPSLWFPEKKDTFTFGYDYGNFTGSAVRKTEPELGWKFTGQMVSENLMVDYVDAAIGQVLTTEGF